MEILLESMFIIGVAIAGVAIVIAEPIILITVVATVMIIGL